MTTSRESLRKPLLRAAGPFFAAVVLSLGSTGCGSGEERAGPGGDSPGLAVEVMEVRSRPEAIVRRSVTGVVEPARSGDIGFEIAGRLAAVRVKEGATVGAGEELAALDTERLRVREREATSALAEAEAELSLAKRTRERIGSAREREAASAQDLDEAERRVEALTARVARLEAAREAVRVDLRKSVLSAPFPGKISRRHADEGKVLPAGAPVLRLIETRRKEIRLGLPEASAARFTEGEERVFRANGREATARLEAVLPDRSGETRSVELRFVFDDPTDRVRSGSLAVTEIEEERPETGFWIPRSALTDNLRGLWAAYVVAASGEEEGTFRAERIDLEVLRMEGERVFVRGGLRDGDRLIRSGVHRIVPGARVVPAEGEGG